MEGWEGFMDCKTTKQNDTPDNYMQLIFTNGLINNIDKLVLPLEKLHAF
jgi:hypothetical protein